MTALVSPPRAALARPLARPGFFAGLGALLGGFAFILRTPSVWFLAAVPVGIACIVTFTLSATAIWLLPQIVTSWIGASTALGQVGALAASTVVTALAVLLSLLVGLAITQPLSGPALTAMVRRVEAGLGVPAWPKTRLRDDWLTALASLALTSAFGLPIFALLVAVNFVLPAAVVVTFPLKLATLALLVAWDLCDYPLSLRGVGARARIRFARRHALALVGFGACLAVVSLVPFAILFVLPAGVAGAAKLTFALERYDESRARGE